MRYFSIIFRNISFFILLASFLMTSCTERDHANIFDPAYDRDSLDMTFYISGSDSVITLEWIPPLSLKFPGYNLYRRIEGQPSFRKIAELPADRKQYDDDAFQFDLRHEYYMTLQGEDSESPPTATISTVPGAQRFWISDRFGLIIYQLTYDLQHEILRKFTLWLPENICFNADAKQALVTYPQFHIIELFNTANSATLLESDKIEYPFDCAYDPASGKYWITDSTGILYRLNPVSDQAEVISSDLIKPLKIVTSSNNNYFILDRGLKEVLVFQNSGAFSESIVLSGRFKLNDPENIEIDKKGRYLYIIDNTNDKDILYRYNLFNEETDSLYEAKDIGVIRLNDSDQTIWLSLNNNGSNSSIVQLSHQGLRLNLLEDFGLISDFHVIPDNGNIIIAEGNNRIVKHIRADSEVIGTFKEAIFPHRIYVE